MIRDFPSPIGTFLLALILAAQSLAHAALPAAVEGEPLPSLAPMLERVTPAVVNISTVTAIKADEHPLLRDPFFRFFFDVPKEQSERKDQSLGSGVIVDAEKGLVLTNHHVVQKADEIEVRLHDGRELVAKLIGSDSETDIALLRIPAQRLTAVGMADSNSLRVGDFVVAIGSPFGLSQTVTSGIVSALGRSGLGIEGFESFIQTDASINPGNSGGPLVDLRGDLVGINTAILAPGGGNVGIGFAIPTSMVRTVMEQLIAHGGVRRGLFGVTAQDLTPELAAALNVGLRHGAVVSSVEPGSAAAIAGLLPGDVITDVNGDALKSASDLRTRVGLMRVGSEVELSLIRAGKTLTLRGAVADPYANFIDGGAISPILKGARLGDLVNKSPRGHTIAVAVGTVTQNSPAWTTGLREGDILLQVNRKRVRNIQELSSVLDRSRSLYRLLIQREDRLITLSRR